MPKPASARALRNRIRPFRVDRFQKDGRLYVLVMALDAHSGHVMAKGHAVSVDEATGAMRFWIGSFQDPLAFDTLGKGDMQRLDFQEGSPDHYRHFGMPGTGGGAIPLAEAILESITRETPSQPRREPADPFADLQRFATGDLGEASRGFDPEEIGYSWVEATLHIPTVPRFPVSHVPAPNKAGIVEPGDYVPAGGWNVKDLVLASANRAISTRLERALAPVRARLHPEANAILGERNWSRRSHDFYAAPGEVGDRRRQAGHLYPAFAPLIAHDERLAGLVDAGRPFEEELTRAVAKWPRDAATPEPTLPLIRRFRTLSPETSIRELQQLLSNAAKLPLDWVPGTREEWDAFGRIMEQVNVFTNTLGLDMADVLRQYPGSWRLFEERGCLVDKDPQARPRSLSARLDDAKDLCRQMEDTLLTPLLMSVSGNSQDAQKLAGNRHEGTRLAASLLFGGRSVANVLRTSDRWHRNLSRFEAALPGSKREPVWPALFARKPRIGKDIVAVPLTRQSELKDEGREGVDLAGVPGLDHCVGGYGKLCYTGESHIVSLRRLLPGGGYERLSTVEFRHSEITGTLEVVQHQGRRNGSPPAEAVEALEVLRGRMRDDPGLLNPKALQTRSATGFDAAFDWRVPGALEQAFAAWEPYLTKASAAAGFEGLRDRVDAWFNDWVESDPGRDARAVYGI